jgi:hypothetical protein
MSVAWHVACLDLAALLPAVDDKNLGCKWTAKKQ